MHVAHLYRRVGNRNLDLDQVLTYVFSSLPFVLLVTLLSMTIRLMVLLMLCLMFIPVDSLEVDV
jgi:hypothetical protein